MPIDLPPPDLAAVVVTARLPKPPGDAAFSMAVIDPKALTTITRLDDALATAPGFSLFRRTSSLGANPTTQGVSLRGIAGSGASRALVTLDGVPQNDPFGGWVIWTGLPTEGIGGATIVRGAGAGPYGAGALTGVVALDSVDQVPGGLAADVSVGELHDGQAAAVADVATGPGRLLLNAAGESSDGWIPVHAGRGAVDRPLTLHDWAGSAREQVPLGPGVLAARIGAYEEDRGAGTVFAKSRARGGQASLTYAVQPGDHSLGYRLQGWVALSDLANDSATAPPPRNTATLANDQYATPARGLGFNAAVRRTEATYSWELGVDVRDDTGESREHLFTSGHPNGNRISGGGENVAGVYAEASRNWDGWLLTGGARLDTWSNYGSKLIQTGPTPLNQHVADRSGTVPTGRIGLRRDISKALYLRTAAYTGFRPATLNELHRSFRVGNTTTQANPDLTPERLYGAEVGVGGDGWLHWDSAVFYNQLANAVTNVTISSGLARRENAGKVNAYGVEAEASHRFSAAFGVKLAADYTHARVDGGSQAAQLTGKRPALTPETTVTATADWRPVDRLGLSADLRYVGDRYDDDLNSTNRHVAAGTGVDARAEWTMTPAVKLYVAADNLFDANIQTGQPSAGVVTYDAPRIVRVGLTFRR